MSPTTHNAILLLFLRAVLLGAVVWFMQGMYDSSIFYVSLSGTQTYITYGLALIALMRLYFELMISFKQVLGRSSSGYITSRPRNFIAEFQLCKIQVASNETHLREQLRELPPSFKTRGITGVATRLTDGRIVWSPNLARHAQLMWYANFVLGEPRTCLGECEQGFISSDGQFLTRQQAAPIAISAGQVSESGLLVAGVLYSEDIF